MSERIYDIELLLHPFLPFGYTLTFQRLQDGEAYRLSLRKEGQRLSHIDLELGLEPELYMQSETKKEHEGKHFNTFLRSVVILIACILRYDKNQRYKMLLSIPHNWISLSFYGGSRKRAKRVL